jgi:hypothetical protein
MELGDETEYYTVKLSVSEPLDIRLGKRQITYRPLRGFKPHPSGTILFVQGKAVFLACF